MKSILAKNYWLKFAALLIVTSLCLVPNAEQVWRQPISTIDQATESGLAKSKLARPRRAPITSQEIDATAEPHLDSAETRANQVCFLLAAARRDAGRYLEAIQLLEQIPPKYRHLEWYLLRRELDGGYMTYFGHRHTVTQAEFSADGSLVLSTDSGGRLKVWDAVTGAALHDHYIDGTATSFSPDTKFIAIGKSDGKVTLLDSATGCELKTMEISDFQINALSISDDAKLLACGTEESLHVLNIDTGVKLFSLVGHTSDVKQVAFNPETTKLASITSDCIKLWDLNTGSELLSIDNHSSWKANVKFSPDGSKLATGSLQENAKVWNVATGTLEFTLSGMSGDLTSLCFNPQGTRIATGSDDHTIKLWDAENGQEIRMLRGHLDEVGCISFSSDGSKILSGSSDGTIKVWNSDEEQFTRTLWSEADDVEDASLSADGMRIASICFNGRLRIWDAESGHQLRSIAVPAANSRRLCLNVDGTKVAIGSEQGIAVWSTETGEVIQTLIGRGGEIHSIQFDPTGDKVAALRNGAIDIWDIATGTHKPLRNDSDSIVSFCFSHDGKWIAAGGYDGLMLWEAETGELRDLITALSQSISHLTFIRESSQLVSTSNVNGASIVTFWDVDTWRELNSIGLAPRPGLLKTVTINANGSRLFTLDTKGQVHLWDADSGQQLLKLVSTTDAHEAMNFSLDEKRVMLSGRDGEIHILDTDFTSEYEHESRLLIGHHDRVTNARFAPDEKTIVTSSNDRTLREWDTLNGQLLRTFRGHIGRISNFVVSEDAERIVSSGDFGELKLWDLSSGTELETLSDYSPGEPSRYHAVAFSPDGQCLAMVNQDNSLSLFEASTGFELHNMTGHVADVFALFFEGNGQRLVSAASDGTLKLWAVDTGQELRTFKGHSEFAYAVNFSPDGRRLVSGSRDATVKLWDIQTGREELTLSGNAGEVHLVCFSPDGMKVVSASVDGKLILWDAQTGQKLISIPAHTEYVDSVRFNADGTEIISITFSGSEEFVWDAATGSHLGNKPRQFRNSSNCLSSDGKYYLLPAFDHVKLVNLSFKNSKNELAFRTAKASFNRQWHSKKAMNAELEKDWRTALFHWAWVVDSNWNANKIIEPTYDVAIDRLKLAYRKWLSEHSITDRRSSAMLSSSQLHSKVRHVLNAVLSSPRLMPPGTAASEIDN